MAELELRTGRLRLRPWRPDDEPAMMAINRDPEVARHLNRPVDELSVQAFFEQIAEHWRVHGFGPWALEATEPELRGRFVGFAGLAHLPPFLAHLPPFLARAAPASELGWRLAREAWGRGLATEAATAARDDALGRLDLKRLVSIIHPDNIRSRRVATKLGMSVECSIANPVLGRDVELWALQRGR